MPNAVDAKIDEVTQAHVAESEAANVSRNVDETAKRVKDAIAEFSALDILASGYWEGLYYEAKILALRNAVLELAAPRLVGASDPQVADSAELVTEVPAPKKARKPKAAA